MNLVLTGGTVVRSLRPPVVEPADLVVEGGRIAEALDTEGPGTTRIDCRGCVIVPGNVCAHTHLYSALARGMPYRLDPPTTFVEILRRVWWRLDRALEPETIRASALAGGLAALRAGTTTLVDHHASPHAIPESLDIIAAALSELGIRSVLCYETSDRDGPEIACAGLAENERFLGVAAREFRLARGMVGAHASFTLADGTLEACGELARRTGTGLHIHAAEDDADEADSIARFGLRVVERLDRFGALDERTLLAHAVHLDAMELRLIRTAGATVVHNARSNMNNGVGRAPLAMLGERVALGTDGIGSDMFEEARAAYFRRRDDDVLTPMAWPVDRLAEGARVAADAFGEPLLGTLLPGAPADLVVLAEPSVTPLGPSTLAAHWLFGFSSGSVRDVVVDGHLVLRDRNPVGVDADEVAAVARESACRLWERLDAIDVHPFVPARPIFP